jgi:hypothetical protein
MRQICLSSVDDDGLVHSFVCERSESRRCELLLESMNLALRRKPDVLPLGYLNPFNRFEKFDGSMPIARAAFLTPPYWSRRA